MDFIERSLEELHVLAVDMGAAVILGGDFNSLNVEEVSIRTGLVPLVKVPTRGGKIFDMLATSIPGQYNIKVITSTVRSDHRAIVATDDRKVQDRSKTSTKRCFRRRTSNQNASLLAGLREFDDSGLMSISDPQEAWDAFYCMLHKWMDEYYPCCSQDCYDNIKGASVCHC